MAEVNIANTEEGRVYLLAGGGKIYTDLAAKFVRTEKPVAELIQEAYNPAIVRNILESHHYSALEFDMLIFGVEGYSRVTEAQLIRKRIASYLIKSGRAELNGKRAHSYVIPENVRNFSCDFNLYSKDLCDHTTVEMCGDDIADICSHFYECGLEAGLPEEDLRYIKPQGTEFKAIIAMNCYDDDTEVLTKRGWLHIDDVKKTDLVYTMNIDTKEVSYIRPVGWISKPYKGEMIHVSTRRLDLMTTPDHNNIVFPYYGRKDKTSKLEFVSAASMTDLSNVKMTRTCERVVGTKIEYIILPEIDNSKYHQNGKYYKELKIPMDEFLTFLGFYISDGNIYSVKTKTEAVAYDITLSKGNKATLEKYKRLVDKWLSIDSKIYYNNAGCHKLQFRNPQLGIVLSKLGTALTKYIPKEIFDLPKEQLLKLLEGFLDGDTGKREDSCTYYTSSPQLADDIQRLLLHCGLSGQIKKIDRINRVSAGISKISGVPYNIETRRVSYAIRFTLNTDHIFETVKDYESNLIKTVHYDGGIHCLTLPKYHSLYVRRNGKPVWSGNCHALRDWFKIRCCENAQHEIRDMAFKMLRLAKDTLPDLLVGAGASCVELGYCPEGKRQCTKFKGKIPTKEQILEVWHKHKNDIDIEDDLK